MINNLKNIKSKIALILVASVVISCNPLKYTKSVLSSNADRIIVTGQVIDEDTGLAMPVVVISTIDKLRQTSTDKDGKYTLDITGCSQKLKAAWIGYHHIYTRNLKLKKGDTAVVNFKMKYDMRPLID
ncbi:hypothetical protein GCM10022246_21080 [Pedobacter ginsengiterrae]|uniref:Carboxypeptidase regulatory-like domain-containing protein n=1 Tax=Pedobacter ginsengiterrae TaxID=871696 RepID=A0ABP7PMD9_9SPHI